MEKAKLHINASSSPCSLKKAGRFHTTRACSWPRTWGGLATPIQRARDSGPAAGRRSERRPLSSAGRRGHHAAAPRTAGASAWTARPSARSPPRAPPPAPAQPDCPGAEPRSAPHAAAAPPGSCSPAFSPDKARILDIHVRGFLKILFSFYLY